MWFRTSSRWALGLCALLGVVVIWVASSVIEENIFLTQDFNKPFFLTFFDTSMFSLYLLGFFFFPGWRANAVGSYRIFKQEGGLGGLRQRLMTSVSTETRSDVSRVERVAEGRHYHSLDQGPRQAEGSNADVVHGVAQTRDLRSPVRDSDATSSPNYHGTMPPGITGQSQSDHATEKVGSASLIDPTTDTLTSAGHDPSTGTPAETDKAPVQEVVWLALQFCFLWFVANYTYNLALTYTTIASCTIISSLSSAFTLILGAFFRVEAITVAKALGIVVCVGGVVVVSLSDSQGDGATQGRGGQQGSVDPLSGSEQFSGVSQVIGDALALFSGGMYACYIVFLRVQVKHEARLYMAMFFGFVGLCSALLLWPIFFLLHLTAWETFEIPSTSMLWRSLAVNAFIGTVLSDYLWLLSVLLTTPVISTLGLSLTIPVAMVADLMLKNESSFSVLYVGGALLVMLGFVLANLPARWLSCSSASADEAQSTQPHQNETVQPQAVT